MRLAIFEGYEVPGAGTGARRRIHDSRGSSRRRDNRGMSPQKEKHMAHRRRRRRGFGDYLTIPGLGNIGSIVKDINPLGQSVKMNDLLMGAGVGMAGGAVVKLGLNKTGIDAKLPGFIADNIGPVSTILAGIGGYMFLKKKNMAKAKGVLYGAMVAGLVPVGWDLLKRQFPTYFGDYVTVPGLGEIVEQPYGVLVEDSSPALNGLNAIYDSDEAF